MSKNQLEFKVQGDSGNLYTVRFEKEGSDLFSSCSCPAGEMGTYCKHRIRLLTGEISKLVSKNESDIANLIKLKAGTELDKILLRLFDREAALESVKKEIKSVKKDLQKFMKVG